MSQSQNHKRTKHSIIKPNSKISFSPKWWSLKSPKIATPITQGLANCWGKKQKLKENQIKILNGFHITEKSLTNSLYEWILETTHACMTEKILLSQNLTLKKRGTKVSLINLRTGTHYSQKSITYHQRVKQTLFLLFAIKI